MSETLPLRSDQPPDASASPAAGEPSAPSEPAAAAPASPALSQPPEHSEHPRRRRRRGGRGRRSGERREDGQAERPVGRSPAAQSPEGAAAPAPVRGSDLPEGEPEPRESSLDRDGPFAATVRDDGAPADIAPERLDADGLRILARLHRFGHQAYFVGGCVRDGILGRPPKDFDIATSAHPGEVRSLFRNCRLIGRRFRLAHVYFRGGKIIEVSTFRANPTEAEVAVDGDEVPEGDLLITRDNVFGSAEEDARRRDFTINGLFYDVQKGRVLDFVDGLRDVHEHLIRTIGNPEIRLREDPVRILRAVRFASRLGFDTDPATYAAMEGAVEDLPRCAPARLLEETFRLLRSGHSRAAVQLLYALGALRVLLPPLSTWLDQASQEDQRLLFERLAALDRRAQQAPVDDAIIIAAILGPLSRQAEAPHAGQAFDGLLEQMVQTARLPRRVVDQARQLLWSMGVLTGERKRRRSLASFRHHPAFDDALALFEIEVEATGQGQESLERWKSGKPFEPPRPPAGEGGPGPGQGKRRRRRRRGGRSGGAGGPGGDGGPGPAGEGGPSGGTPPPVPSAS